MSKRSTVTVQRWERGVGELRRLRLGLSRTGPRYSCKVAGTAAGVSATQISLLERGMTGTTLGVLEGLHKLYAKHSRNGQPITLDDVKAAYINDCKAMGREPTLYRS